MKNLHLLPTKKISKLVYDTNDNLALTSIKMAQEFCSKKVHIYITSDEEISECDFSYTNQIEGNIVKIDKQTLAHKEQLELKKVILTTDQDLIKDGVQEIDDEFLEWFVNNPNCEDVEVTKMLQVRHGVAWYDLPNQKEGGELEGIYRKVYKITIPKEEEFELVSIGERTIKLAIPMIQDKEEIKQETLEEAAERLYPTTINSFTDSGFDMSETERLIFINGAKWQQEDIIKKLEMHILVNEDDWNRNPQAEFRNFIEQFKK